MTQATDKTKFARRNRTAAQFFWGTIAVMALGTVGLQIMASRNVAKSALPTANAPGPTEITPSPAEISAEKLRQALEQAPDAVLQKVMPQLDPLLDRAFQPVYDGIPAYADFHYSVRGEYTELVVAVAGNLEADLEKRLFQGLQQRLQDVSTEMDGEFRRAYEQILGERIRLAAGSVDLGEMTRKATRDAVQRVAVTAPVAAATAVVGTVSMKAISKAVAKKVAAKVAVKATSKGALKGGSVLGGMGTGAAICSPTGLVAVACGVIGGAIAWVATDAVVIGLDELLNREEFEQNLREAIDAEKARVRQAMTQQLQVKRVELIRMAPQQAQDLTLSQLSQDRRMQVCDMAQVLFRNYALIQNDIAARNLDNLAAFRTHLDQAGQQEILRPLADDMRASIDADATRARISHIRLGGNFRSDDRADRDVTVQVWVQDHAVTPMRIKATQDGGFALSVPADIATDLSRNLEMRAGIEQHLRIRSNRYFGGRASIKNALETVQAAQGLRGKLSFSVPTTRDEQADSLAMAQMVPGPSAILTASLDVMGEKLRDPMPFSACPAQ